MATDGGNSIPNVFWHVNGSNDGIECSREHCGVLSCVLNILCSFCVDFGRFWRQFEHFEILSCVLSIVCSFCADFGRFDDDLSISKDSLSIWKGLRAFEKMVCAFGNHHKLARFYTIPVHPSFGRGSAPRANSSNSLLSSAAGRGRESYIATFFLNGGKIIKKRAFAWHGIFHPSKTHVSGCNFAHTDPFETSDGALESYERETHENDVKTLKNIIWYPYPAFFGAPQIGNVKSLKNAQN